MRRILLKSPAKLNLSLDVIGKTKNNYHLLQTIVQTVDIYDYIVFSKNDSNKLNITSDINITLLMEENIIYKTIMTFFERVKIPFCGLDIEISKKIPLQSGLGGGSSNAATTLIALNYLFDTNLETKQLIEMAKTLGSDVPLFLLGGTCLCEGAGEIITQLPDLPNIFFIVIKPSIGFSTSEIYNNLDKISIKKHPETNKLIHCLNDFNIFGFCNNTYNVLEEAIPNKEILNIKNLLINRGALSASMTGSGSAIFGIFIDKILAQNALSSINSLHLSYDTFLCQPINPYKSQIDTD